MADGGYQPGRNRGRGRGKSLLPGRSRSRPYDTNVGRGHTHKNELGIRPRDPGSRQQLGPPGPGTRPGPRANSPIGAREGKSVGSPPPALPDHKGPGATSSPAGDVPQTVVANGTDSKVPVWLPPHKRGHDNPRHSDRGGGHATPKRPARDDGKRPDKDAEYVERISKLFDRAPVNNPDLPKPYQHINPIPPEISGPHNSILLPHQRLLTATLSDVQRKYLARHWPNIEFVPKPGAKPHPHYCLALERREMEDRIVKMAGHRAVVDVGGNPRRHRDAHRRNVWSCCPELDANDFARNAQYDSTGVSGFCRHRAEACTCVRADMYICIHSIYYLSPDTVYTLVQKSASNILYALVHVFDAPYGAMGPGEAEFRVDGNGMVTMAVDGNSKDYVHPNCVWLRTGYYEPPMAMNAIQWEVVDQGPTTKILRFMLVPRGFTNHIPIPRTMASSIKDELYYGDLEFAPLLTNSHTRRNASTDVVEFVASSLYSWGAHIITSIQIEGKRETAYVPKDAITEIATRMLGCARTPEQYVNCISLFRKYMDNIAFPAQFRHRAVLVGATIAFTYDLEMEAAVLNTMLGDYGTLMTMHTRLLRFQNYFRITKFRAAATTVVLILIAYRRHWWKQLALLLGLGWAWPPSHQTLTYSQQVINAYRRWRSGIPYIKEHLQPAEPKLAFPGTITDVPLKPMQLNPDGKPYPYRPSTKLDPTMRDLLKPAGLMCPRYIPIVYQSCPTNEVASIVNRVCAQVPDVAPATEARFAEFWGNIIEWVSGPQDQLENGDYETWNCRFPRHQQVRHDAALHNMRIGKYDQTMYFHKKFTKVEKQLLMVNGEYTAKAPRSIQGCTDEFNVCVGPYEMEYNNRLMRIWSVSGNVCYAAAKTSEQLGGWFYQHYDPGDLILEIDESKMDTHVRRAYSDAETRAREANGADAEVIKHMDAALVTVGYGTWGSMYTCDNRPSGVSKTSSGNSAGSVSLTYEAFQWVGESREVLLDGIHILVMGDDRLVIVKKRFLERMYAKFGRLLDAEIAQRVVKAELEVGFEATITTHRSPYTCTFCSGRFYPIIPDATVKQRAILTDEKGIPVATTPLVFGPMIGRVLAKMGWFVDKPDRLLRAYLRGAALSVQNDVSHIPVLGALVRMYLRITRDACACNENPYAVQHKFHATVAHKSDPGQMAVFISEVYGVTMERVAEIEKLFNSIDYLPQYLSSNLCDEFLATDCA